MKKKEYHSSLIGNLRQPFSLKDIYKLVNEPNCNDFKKLGNESLLNNKRCKEKNTLKSISNRQNRFTLHKSTLDNKYEMILASFFSKVKRCVKWR